MLKLKMILFANISIYFACFFNQYLNAAPITSNCPSGHQGANCDGKNGLLFSFKYTLKLLYEKKSFERMWSSVCLKQCENSRW